LSGVVGSGCTFSPGINVVANTMGTAGNSYGLSSQVSYDSGDFSSPSFTVTLSGATLTGGGQSTAYDAGSVSVTVQGHQTAASYSQGATAQSVTSALINAINADPNAYVNASSYLQAILLTSRQAGSIGDNYSLSVSRTYDTADFTGASFDITASGPSLDGGVDGSAATSMSNVLYSLGLGYFPNSDIQTANDSTNGSWSYTYDEFNRLQTSGSLQGGYQYNYDRYGNRLQQALTYGTGVTVYLSDSGNSNQLDGQCYDAAGNVLDDAHSCAYMAAPKYLYDAENRLVNVYGGPVYVYDASGQRIAKQSGTPGGLANTDTNEYLLSQNGEQLAEFVGGALDHTNVYAAGRLWTTFSGSGTSYHTTDWLGTRRVQTNASAAVTLNCSNLPFGDNQNCVGSDVTEQHFTGKERDTESGNDYFGARYYASTMGRFMSPDWSAQQDPVPYAKLDNPQTLNLYGYMQNNPLGGVDQDGHCDWCQRLLNTVTFKGFLKTDAQVTAANGTVTTTQGDGWTTDTGGDFGSSTMNFDPTGGMSLQVSGSAGGYGGAISYTPGTGEIDGTASVGALDLGGSVTVSNSAPDTGPSVTAAGFVGVGGSVTQMANGGTSTAVGLGTPGVSASIDRTAKLGSVAPVSTSITVPNIAPGNAACGGGICVEADGIDFGR
jgi:RHS repeat-associated protein